MDPKIQALEEELVNKEFQELPFRPGDIIRVHERISDVGEGTKERLQVFEGVVLQIRGRGSSRMFTVRKESFGVGVEKVFPLHSPRIAKIEVVERGRARRARLFYLRRRRER